MEKRPLGLLEGIWRMGLHCILHGGDGRVALLLSFCYNSSLCLCPSLPIRLFFLLLPSLPKHICILLYSLRRHRALDENGDACAVRICARRRREDVCRAARAATTWFLTMTRNVWSRWRAPFQHDLPGGGRRRIAGRRATARRCSYSAAGLYTCPSASAAARTRSCPRYRLLACATPYSAPHLLLSPFHFRLLPPSASLPAAHPRMLLCCSGSSTTCLQPAAPSAGGRSLLWERRAMCRIFEGTGSSCLCLSPAPGRLFCGTAGREAVHAATAHARRLTAAATAAFQTIPERRT